MEGFFKSLVKSSKAKSGRMPINFASVTGKTLAYDGSSTCGTKVTRNLSASGRGFSGLYRRNKRPLTSKPCGQPILNSDIMIKSTSTKGLVKNNEIVNSFTHVD